MVRRITRLRVRYLALWPVLTMAAFLTITPAMIHADASLKAALDLSAHVYDVKGLGPWSQGSFGGQVRLVITRTNKQDKAYLQWVEWEDSQPVKVRSTISINEINGVERFTVQFIRRENKVHDRKIILGLETVRTKEILRANIRLLDVGLYECEITR